MLGEENVKDEDDEADKTIANRGGNPATRARNISGPRRATRPRDWWLAASGIRVGAVAGAASRQAGRAEIQTRNARSGKGGSGCIAT